MGGGGGAVEHTGRSKEGSAEDKQRDIDVKLGKTQSLKPLLTHSEVPPRYGGVTLQSAPKGVKIMEMEDSNETLFICHTHVHSRGHTFGDLNQRPFGSQAKTLQPPFHINSLSYPHFLS